jgi:hypothetical protein
MQDQGNFKGKLLETCQKRKTQITSAPTFTTRAEIDARKILRGYICTATVGVNGQNLSVQSDVCNTKKTAEQQASSKLLQRLPPEPVIASQKPAIELPPSSFTATTSSTVAAVAPVPPPSTTMPLAVNPTSDWTIMFMEKCRACDIEPIFDMIQVGSGWQTTINFTVNGEKQIVVSDALPSKKTSRNEACRLAYVLVQEVKEVIVSETTNERIEMFIHQPPIAPTSSAAANAPVNVSQPLMKTVIQSTSTTEAIKTYKSKLVDACNRLKYQVEFVTEQVAQAFFKCRVILYMPGCSSYADGSREYCGEAATSKKLAENNSCKLALVELVSLGQVSEEVLKEELKLTDESTSRNWKGELLDFCSISKIQLTFSTKSGPNGGFKSILRMSVDEEVEVLESDYFVSKKMADQNVSMKAMARLTSNDFKFENILLAISNSPATFNPAKRRRVAHSSSSPANQIQMEEFIYCSLCGSSLGFLEDFMFYCKSSIDVLFVIKPECAVKYRSQISLAHLQTEHQLQHMSTETTATIDDSPAKGCEASVVASSLHTIESLHTITEPLPHDHILRYGRRSEIGNLLFTVRDSERLIDRLQCGSCYTRIGCEDDLGDDLRLLSFAKERTFIIDRTLCNGKRWADEIVKAKFGHIEKRKLCSITACLPLITDLML